MEPRWAPDGRELYFLDGAVRLVAATIRASASGIEVTDLKPLFDASGMAIDIFHTSYDVLPGGRGFIFARQRSDRTALQPAMVEAENWFADVRARTTR
jgi:hypothetical protein